MTSANTGKDAKQVIVLPAANFTKTFSGKISIILVDPIL
jgi:hypothetical protein